MPLYEYECEHGHNLELWYQMGEAPLALDLAHDDTVCSSKRVFGCQFTEDRRHMRRGISAATGEPVAQSRSEERMIEKTKGIEFIGRAEMPSQWKKLGEYARHVNSGGERVDPHAVNPAEITSSKGELLRKMAERGASFG